MSVAHATHIRYPQTTVCGINTIANCCATNIRHNTLCKNCSRIIQNHIYKLDGAYEIWWYNPNSNITIPTCSIKLRYVTITVVEFSGESIHINIHDNYCYKSKPLHPDNILAAIDAIILWIESGYYQSVSMRTFMECVTNATTP